MAGLPLPVPDKFERFENWLRENGAKFELVRLVSAGLV
jgi:hypothetical protein